MGRLRGAARRDQGPALDLDLCARERGRAADPEAVAQRHRGEGGRRRGRVRSYEEAADAGRGAHGAQAAGGGDREGARPGAPHLGEGSHPSREVALRRGPRAVGDAQGGGHRSHPGREEPPGLRGTAVPARGEPGADHRGRDRRLRGGGPRQPEAQQGALRRPAGRAGRLLDDPPRARGRHGHDPPELAQPGRMGRGTGVQGGRPPVAACGPARSSPSCRTSRASRSRPGWTRSTAAA